MSAFGTYLYTYASLCLSALVLCSGIFLISCLAVRKRSGVSPKRQALWFVTLWYLISLSMILFTTGHSGENDVNLYPLRSIYSAVADTGVSLSQLIVLTSGLFVPFGFLLMLVIRRRPLQYFIPLFSLDTRWRSRGFICSSATGRSTLTARSSACSARCSAAGCAR